MIIFFIILFLIIPYIVFVYVNKVDALYNELDNNYKEHTEAYSILAQERDALEANIKELQAHTDKTIRTITESNEAWRKSESQKIRDDALSKQKQVRTGYTSEHFAPFAIPDWEAQDYFRVGGSIDYLVVLGADAVRDGRAKEVDKIVLLDIKTGGADLNTVQRRIRDAVVAGKVSFATFNMTTGKLKEWELQTQKELS
jgi:predicted Holliday junction resolvase-like endonuclease